MSMGKCDERYRNVFCSGTFEESSRNRGCVIIRHVFVILQMLYKAYQILSIHNQNLKRPLANIFPHHL